MEAIETGQWMSHRAALACLKAYIDASDDELKALGIERPDCLKLARSFIGEQYELTALATMFERIATAYALGKRA